MAIALRAAGTATNGNASVANVTLTKPAGVTNDDIMVVVLYNENAASGAWNLPSGWAWWGGDTGAQCGTRNAWVHTCWKKAASEGSSWVFDLAGSNSWVIGSLVTFSGGYTGGDPEDSSGPTSKSAASGENDPIWASITTSSANDMLIAGCGDYNSNTLDAGASGMTLAVQLAGCGFLYLLQASAGASGTKTGNFSSSTDRWGTWHQAIKEASGVTTLSISATDTFTNTQALD